LTPLGDTLSTAGVPYSSGDSLAVRSGCLPE